jgi:hypothetical protein
MLVNPELLRISVALEDQGDMVPILGVIKKKLSAKLL